MSLWHHKLDIFIILVCVLRNDIIEICHVHEKRYILHNIANCNELLNNIRAERRHPIKLSLAKPSQPDPYWSSMVSIHVFRKRRLRIFKAMKFMQTHRFIRLSLFLTQNYIDKLVRF